MRGPNLLFFDSLFGIFFFSFPRIFFFFSPSSFFQQQLLQQQQQLDEPLLLLLNADFEHLVLVIVFCFWLCVLCGTLKKKKKATSTKKKGRGKVFSILFFCVCRVKNRPERDKNEEYYRGHTTYKVRLNWGCFVVPYSFVVLNKNSRGFLEFSSPHQRASGAAPSSART